MQAIPEQEEREARIVGFHKTNALWICLPVTPDPLRGRYPLRLLCFPDSAQHVPYHLKCVPFTLQKSGQTPSPCFRLDMLHRFKFFFRHLHRRLGLARFSKDLGKGFPDDLLVNALRLQFLIDPSPAEPAEPDPAPRPLTRELLIIHIPQPRQVSKHCCYDRIIEFLITQLCFDLRPAARPIGKIAIRRVLRPCQLLFLLNPKSAIRNPQ